MSNNIRITNIDKILQIFPKSLSGEIILAFRKDGECSSCGLELGDEKCYVEIGMQYNAPPKTNAFGMNQAEIVGAKLYPRHLKCSKKFQGDSFTGACTWHANSFAEAVPTPEGPAVTPVFVVNPSIDVIMVVKNPLTKEWPKSLIEAWETNGFHKADMGEALADAPAGTVTIFSEYSTIRVETYFESWDLQVPQNFIQVIREAGGMLVALSFDADAKMLEVNNNCEKFMRGSKTVQGWVTLTEDANKTK